MYQLKKEVGISYVDAVAKAREELQKEGFGVLTEIDVKSTLKKKLDVNFPLRMMRGVKLDDGYMTKQCQVVIVGERSFSIILTEGKKRQIRRMCEALGYRVTDLLRTRIMNIKLGDLKPGHYTELKGAELKDFLKSIRLEK
jgi:23S rRNA pseudouridine2604 synthase